MTPARRTIAVGDGFAFLAGRRRDQVAVLVGLAGVTAATWVYVVLQAQSMTNSSMAMTGASMSGMNAMAQPWALAQFSPMLLMWAAMMVAMMVPTAVPMTFVYAAVARKAASQHNPVAPTFVFVAGYATIWILFSVAATVAQTALGQRGLLSPVLATSSALLGGALLIAAGLYQLTPLKRACLKQCRTPAHFLSQHWRTGVTGAYRLGARLGVYCLGCCWVLMSLLFVGGVMNLLWVAAIAVLILLEKVAPFGERGGWIAGGALVVAGAVTVVR